MIAVLADDFSGAAEVAAIARRYGLLVEVHTTFQPSSSADLVVIDTDTRSTSRAEAEHRVAEEVRRLDEGGVGSVYYKKVDSVLRGHVVAELRRVLELTGRQRALLAPFNPSYGQTIRDRRYAIRGTPLDETRFAEDPEYPVRTADVVELLDRDEMSVHYVDPGTVPPDDGIIVSGGSTRADLVALAGKLDPRSLPAGGAEFLDVLLQHWIGRGRAAHPATHRIDTSDPVLVVIGSMASQNWAVVEGARAELPIVPMPPELRDAGAVVGAAVAQWSAEARHALERTRRVVVAVEERPPSPGAGLRAHDVPATLAELVHRLSAGWTDPLHIIVSGGATASMIVRRLGWSALRVIGEAGPGVTTLAPEGRPGRLLTVKPGSYPWPEAVAVALRGTEQQGELGNGKGARR